MADNSDTIYRVVEPFSFDEDGHPWVMRKGDLIGPRHPAYKRYAESSLLEPVDAGQASAPVTSTRAVETASAAPGQRRSRTTPPVKD